MDRNFSVNELLRPFYRNPKPMLLSSSLISEIEDLLASGYHLAQVCGKLGLPIIQLYDWVTIGRYYLTGNIEPPEDYKLYVDLYNMLNRPYKEKELCQ